MLLRDLIGDLEKGKKGLLSVKQYIQTGMFVDIMSPCNLLVFGLGGDSYFWNSLNENGRTIFIEDDSEWVEKFKELSLNIELVEYKTSAKDYKDLNFNAEKLRLNLPKRIRGIEWDVVVVDGPLGHGPPSREFKGPGRMQSIFTAWELLKPGGICIVDDYERDIEKLYSNHFFGEDRIYQVIDEKIAIFKKL